MLPISVCSCSPTVFQHEFALMTDDKYKKLQSLLTHCILVYSSTIICWMSPFVILVVLRPFFRFCFYSFLDGQS